MYLCVYKAALCYRTYCSTLPRKSVAQEGSVRPSTLTRTASLHTRSQSLIDIGRGNVEDMRKASLNALIEQRRRGISKLRGLIIPEKVSDVVAPNHTICDLPEIRSRDSILTNNKAPAMASLQRCVNLGSNLRFWGSHSHKYSEHGSSWLQCHVVYSYVSIKEHGITSLQDFGFRPFIYLSVV